MWRAAPSQSPEPTAWPLSHVARYWVDAIGDNRQGDLSVRWLTHKHDQTCAKRTCSALRNRAEGLAEGEAAAEVKISSPVNVLVWVPFSVASRRCGETAVKLASAVSQKNEQSQINMIIFMSPQKKKKKKHAAP